MYFCDLKPDTTKDGLASTHPSLDTPAGKGTQRLWEPCEWQPLKGDGTGKNCNRAEEAGEKTPFFCALQC